MREIKSNRPDGNAAGDKSKEISAVPKSQVSLIFSALKMALATFSSRILGLVREQVMAAYFGAGGLTDAFNIAYRIPHALRDLFAEGVFSSAFVPVFTEAKVKDFERAKKLLWSMAIILGLFTFFMSGLMFFFAEDLIYLVTNKSFSDEKEKFTLTVTLLQIMSPFLVLISLAALFMGVLNSLKIFFIPSLAPAFFNMVMIFSIVVVRKVFIEQGLHPIFSLGAGVVAGGLIQLLIQLPLVIKNNLAPWSLKKGSFHQIFDHEAGKIIGRLGIGTIGVATTQINVFVNTILATGTLVGAVSWLSYAFRLFQFPVGILGVSLAGSNLVHFSDAWKKGDKNEAIQSLRASYLMAWLVIIPALFLMLSLNKEMVNLIFERGAFKTLDTIQTASALKFYLVGLPFYSFYKIFAPTFFAIDRPKIPVVISIICVAFNIVFCLLTVREDFFEALALGTSFSITLNCFLQIIFLKKHLDLKLAFFMDMKIVKYLFCGVMCWVCSTYFAQSVYDFQDSLPNKILAFFLAGSSGALVYMAGLYLLGEGKNLKALLKR